MREDTLVEFGQHCSGRYVLRIKANSWGAGWQITPCQRDGIGEWLGVFGTS